MVLYFYPKADTPGCTTPACSIRDHRGDYEAAGVRVIGVSPDPVARVKTFQDKESLDFTLLADEDHAVSEASGVLGREVHVRQEVLGRPRATFIIGEDGTVERVFPKVSPKTHDDVVLAALADLAAWGVKPGRYYAGLAAPQHPRARGQLEAARGCPGAGGTPLAGRPARPDPWMLSTPPWAPPPR